MKLCILAAGKGSRNRYSKILPKGFLPINDKPGITHIIDSLPELSEVVIAIGDDGDIYEQFFPILYPNTKFIFVKIENSDGPGSGPGTSLLECETHLKEEFILIPTDAYVDEKIENDWNKNWMGVSRVESTRLFCLLGVDKNQEIKDIFDKDPNAPLDTLENGFNGIAFIKDYDKFFESLKNNQDIISGEVQVSNGFQGLMNINNGPGLFAHRIETWCDFGSSENYSKLINRFSTQNLIKNDEFTYIYNDFVYKYSINKSSIQKKISRSHQLKDLVPNIEKSTDNFYSYKFIEGNLLSEVDSLSVFSNFLEFCKSKLFLEHKLEGNELSKFYTSCKEFYYEKTLSRLNQFWDKYEITDQEYFINGIKCQSIKTMFNKIDWVELSKGEPYNFHGDLQPENIISKGDNFWLIDWRESFGESINIGDIYYDLAKLNHALLLSGKIVRKNLYGCDIKDKDIKISFNIDNLLQEYNIQLLNFIDEEGYDKKKVQILSSLIFLNIAPLYEGTYSKLLYFLGQFKLNQVLYN